MGDKGSKRHPQLLHRQDWKLRLSAKKRFILNRGALCPEKQKEGGGGLWLLIIKCLPQTDALIGVFILVSYLKNFFYGHTPGMWKFLGQGSHLSRSWDLCHTATLPHRQQRQILQPTALGEGSNRPFCPCRRILNPLHHSGGSHRCFYFFLINLFFFVFLPFLGPLLRPVEVPRLGV